METLPALLRPDRPGEGAHVQYQLRIQPRLLVARLLLRQPLGIVYRRAQRGLHAQQPQGRLGLEQRAQLQTPVRQAQYRPDSRL